MISGISRNLSPVVEKLEPIAVAMPAFAIGNAAYRLGLYLNPRAPCYLQRESMVMSTILLTSGLSTLYSKKMGIIASTISVLATQFYSAYEIPFRILVV